MEEYKEKLAQHILHEGGTLFGGYVYKTLIRGESSRDLDVVHRDPPRLVETLKNLFSCREILSDEEMFGARALECENAANKVCVDIIPHLEERNIPTHWVTCDSSGLQCTGNISQSDCNSRIRLLSARKVPGWAEMREKDLLYFDTAE